ncbi:hypothetical protein D8B29_02420 [Verminephrobacter eiseniae]|nr:AzlD domain-containing protein [Verminephrobacter eiseniae]MCW5283493.1 hypothetical protein [Verminephrobacter eiseniae]MCW5301202.1 hypothetical protein [Verminephrobacter eiseniae]MCW8178526.1 hypothetical protein [Verminephrobacter eiseniae]MCW8189190.1 hypothetical protein [Verminephrobacter eiseniae]
MLFHPESHQKEHRQMNQEALIGAALLFLISIAVRIVPAFTRIRLSEQRSEEIKTILPIAVLINLMLYCVVSEASHHQSAALIGFGVLAVLVLLRRVNLLLMVALASAAYLFVR